MMKTLSILSALMLPLAPSTARADGDPAAVTAPSPVVLSNVWLEGDSVVVGIRFDFADVDTRPGLALWFSPVLKSETRHLVLPAVVVSGKARARADRRNRFLDAGRSTREPEPYRVLKGNHPRRGNELDYRATAAYSPWMQTASLYLMQESKDCCRLSLMGIDLLNRQLALSAGFTLPADSSAALYALMLPAPATPVASAPVPPAADTLIVAPRYYHRPVSTAEALTPCAECTAMVSYLVPELEKSKERTDGTTLYIDYPANVDDIRRHYRNNAVELQRLDSLMRPLTREGLTTFRQISVTGYASPEGSYADNEQLASRRARGFMRYLQQNYHLPEALCHVSWIPEDWDGLVRLLEAERPEYADEAVALIRRYAVFDGRERRLMDLRGGVPYRRMLKDQFPRLRRLQLSVDYRVRDLSIEEAARLIYIHPRLLSLQEMYRVASFYRPGTEQYREIYEIAAFHFPDDVVANVNAASAVIMAGDPVSAGRYLEKVKDDPRAWNNLGVLAYLSGKFEEAAEWFRRAAGAEPEKARKNLRKLGGMKELKNERVKELKNE